MNTYLNSALQALGDPTRLAILQNLAERPRGVTDLARGFPVSRPAISQHLKVLKTAGLVTDHRDGTQRVYQIDPKGIAALKLHFDHLWSSVLSNFKESAEQRAALAAADSSTPTGAADKTAAADQASPKSSKKIKGNGIKRRQ